MSQNLAQRIGQEFKTLRANELSLKVDAVTLSNMFEKSGDTIVFKDNLASEQGSIAVKDVDISGSLNVGTGAKGDILYHNGTSYVKLPKGTDGQVLTIVDGLPVWGIGTIG